MTLVRSRLRDPFGVEYPIMKRSGTSQIGWRKTGDTKIVNQDPMLLLETLHFSISVLFGTQRPKKDYWAFCLHGEDVILAPTSELEECLDPKE